MSDHKTIHCDYCKGEIIGLDGRVDSLHMNELSEEDDDHEQFFEAALDAFIRTTPERFGKAPWDAMNMAETVDRLLNGNPKLRAEAADALRGGAVDRVFMVLHFDCMRSHGHYAIPLTRIGTYERAVSWTFQVYRKPWVNAYAWCATLEALFVRRPA